MLQRFGDDWPEREVKFAPVDLKSVEADGTFSGYASLFGEVDLGQGTAHRAGHFTEHGTLRQRATPWLYPAFVARLPRIKQTLRNILVRSFRDSRSKI
jgi:hypothetical protein